MAEITVSMRVAVLELALNNVTSEEICRRLAITPEIYRRIVQAHGYPKEAKMRWALDVMKRDLDAQTPGRKPAATSAQPAPDVDEVVEQPKTCWHTELLLAGRKSGKARTRNMAERLDTMLADLRNALAEEEQRERQRKEEKLRRQREARAAKAKRAAERVAAKAKAKLAALEEEERRIAAAKAQVNAQLVAAFKGEPVADAADEAPAPQVRAWAAEAGLDCPARGAIPKRIREAYAAAHTTAA